MKAFLGIFVIVVAIGGASVVLQNCGQGGLDRVVEQQAAVAEFQRVRSESGGKFNTCGPGNTATVNSEVIETGIEPDFVSIRRDPSTFDTQATTTSGSFVGGFNRSKTFEYKLVVQANFSSQVEPILEERRQIFAQRNNTGIAPDLNVDFTGTFLQLHSAIGTAVFYGGSNPFKQVSTSSVINAEYLAEFARGNENRIPEGRACAQLVATIDSGSNPCVSPKALVSGVFEVTCDGSSCTIDKSGEFTCNSLNDNVVREQLPVQQELQTRRGCNAIPEGEEVNTACAEAHLPAECNNPVHLPAGALFGTRNCSLFNPFDLDQFQKRGRFLNRDGVDQLLAISALQPNDSGQTRLDNFIFFNSYYKAVTGRDYTGGYGAGALPYYLCTIGKTNADYQRWIADNDNRFGFDGSRAVHNQKQARKDARAQSGYKGMFGCGNFGCFNAGACDDLGRCLPGKGPECAKYGRITNSTEYRCFGNLSSSTCTGAAFGQ
jgi:hypothetical protein